MKSGEEAPPKSQLLLCFSVEGLEACKHWFFKMAWVSTCCVLAIQKVFTKALFSPRLLWRGENSELTHIRSFKEEIWYIYIFVCSKKTIYVWCDVVVVKLLNKLYFLKMQYPKVPCHSLNSIKYSHISISPLVCGWRRGCVPPCCVFISPPSPKIGPTGFPPILKTRNKKKKKKGKTYFFAFLPKRNIKFMR